MLLLSWRLLLCALLAGVMVQLHVMLATGKAIPAASKLLHTYIQGVGDKGVGWARHMDSSPCMHAGSEQAPEHV